MRRANQALAEQLALAGWRPPRLVAAVNSLFGEGYLSRSTVSEWLHAGRVPREPLPGVVAQLLSEATGNRVRVDELWPGAAPAPAWWVPADQGLVEIARSANPGAALAEDWLRHADQTTGRDRRHFTPVPALGAYEKPPCRAVQHGTAADPWSAAARAVAEQIDRHQHPRAALRFAHRQVLAFAELLLDTPGEDSLVLALAAVTAAAGRAAEVSAERGLAQRYLACSAMGR